MKSFINVINNKWSVAEEIPLSVILLLNAEIILLLVRISMEVK